MKKLVFATNNKHKIEEVSAMLSGKFELLSMKDIHCDIDIAETADTFEGNALIKAKYIYENFNCDCFADDSGLEVEALDGKPGIYSARYAGNHDSDANMNKLLAELKEKTNRNAQFRTVIALILDGETHIFEGIIKGTIAQKKLGSGGFGYDPIFIPEGYQQSFAQLGIDVKKSISHRARAMEKLFKFLHSKFS